MLMVEQRFQIAGMDCADCARSIEKGVARLEQVEAAVLNFTTGTLAVRGPVAAERVVARVRELGYDVAAPTAADRRPTAAGESAEPLQGQQPAIGGQRSAVSGVFPYLWGRTDTRAALIAALLVLPGLLFDELLPGLGIESPLFAALSVLAMVVAGLPIARSALRALRVNHEITINLLMTIAAVGAVVIGAYTEAGLVMVLFALGEALEGYTAARARDAMRGLAALAPTEAIVLRDGGESRVAVADLRVGDVIVVRPGERLPMDGRVLAGASAVDQAPITGESRAVDKAPGDEVFAGSVNGQGTLEIGVTAVAEDTTISRMIRLVADAQERRAPAQRFVDRFARVYTPTVIVVALLVAIVPPLLFDAPFLDPAPDVRGWLYRALALLVVACPCALVISTPVTLISAISNGARHGVLFKGGAYLEALSRVRAIAFDKTGTLTRGEPVVVEVVASDQLSVVSDQLSVTADQRLTTNDHGQQATDNWQLTTDNLLALAAAVERRSEHPLARAVVAAAEARGAGVGDGRRGAARRRAAAVALCRATGPRRHAHGALQRRPEHRHQAGLLRPGAARLRQHVAGRAGRRGHVAAGDGQRDAPAALAAFWGCELRGEGRRETLREDAERRRERSSFPLRLSASLLKVCHAKTVSTCLHRSVLRRGDALAQLSDVASDRGQSLPAARPDRVARFCRRRVSADLAGGDRPGVAPRLGPGRSRLPDAHCLAAIIPSPGSWCGSATGCRRRGGDGAGTNGPFVAHRH